MLRFLEIATVKKIISINSKIFAIKTLSLHKLITEKMNFESLVGRINQVQDVLQAWRKFLFRITGKNFIVLTQRTLLKIVLT